MHWGILFSPKKNGSVFNEITIANNRFYDWKDYAKWKGWPGTFPHCDQISGLVMPVSIGVTDICSTSNPTELDYNAYYMQRGDGRVIGICNPSTQKVTYVSVSGVRGMGLGYEAHGYQGDPRWVDISKGLRSASCGTNNLHLQSGSPLRGAGTDLSTIFTTDKDGKARSSGISAPMNFHRK